MPSSFSLSLRRSLLFLSPRINSLWQNQKTSPVDLSAFELSSLSLSCFADVFCHLNNKRAHRDNIVTDGRYNKNNHNASRSLSRIFLSLSLDSQPERAQGLSRSLRIIIRAPGRTMMMIERGNVLLSSHFHLQSPHRRRFENNNQQLSYSCSIHQREEVLSDVNPAAITTKNYVDINIFSSKRDDLSYAHLLPC